MQIPSIAALKSSVDRALGLREGIHTELTQVRSQILSLEKEENLLNLVGTLLRTFIDKEIKIGVQAVEQLQTEGLQAVFDDQDLRVRADVDIQRGKVSVDLTVIQKDLTGQEVEGLGKDAFGGSVVTVQSVLLRLILILRRGLRPVLFLDETLPAFDGTYVVNMGKFLSTLAKNLNVDILVVTHNQALVEAADKAYNIVRRGGSVKFEVVR